MSITSKILTGTLLGAGVLAAVSYVKKLKKTQAELEIIPKANLYQLNWNAIVLRVDVLLKNPTKGTFSIKFPFIKILYNGTTIGSSQAVNKEIKIPAYGETVIEKNIGNDSGDEFFLRNQRSAERPSKQKACEADSKSNDYCKPRLD